MMKNFNYSLIIIAVAIVTPILVLNQCKQIDNNTLLELKALGLVGEEISAETFFKGIEPRNFKKMAKANYKPSFNEDPGIPAQCWIETSYGTQNACKYCHTNYLSSINHGNAFPIAEDQITYTFPTANLNRILWQNVIYPENVEKRLASEGISIPDIDEVDYIRFDNWAATYDKVRGNNEKHWLNSKTRQKNYILFPALNPNHLFPYDNANPTSNATHGYIDNEGFVRNEKNEYTGWRAINFFPYAIFTPLTGSVSGIYIRLPDVFMMNKGELCINTYKKNLDLLEDNIKNRLSNWQCYVGDASTIAVKKGFYPLGTEFAHPLHYVDLLADGEVGTSTDGVLASESKQFEFPGTRAKRVKEIRYMYKWKDVDLKDIALSEEEEAEHNSKDFEYEKFIGREGQGWVENGSGWILAAYIENRNGDLRPQTSEELAQCIGCHAKVGNTIDAVWSFQRKLPGIDGWADMNYGWYNSKKPTESKMHDYLNHNSNLGELGYFFYSVVGADLYGVMPNEIRMELLKFAESNNIENKLSLTYSIADILNDEILKYLSKDERKPRLLERQKLMLYYSQSKAYLRHNKTDSNLYVKGEILYPNVETMKSNIQGYRKVVLDQSFNLGKDLFGSISSNIPFTFRSDGTVVDENGKTIPTGNVIYSRPYNNKGIGITQTGIIKGDAIDQKGNLVEDYTSEDIELGKVKFTGTLDMLYNPILSSVIVED
jgi:hypothetical protein